MKLRDVLSREEKQAITKLEKKMKLSHSTEEYKYYKSQVGFIIKKALAKQKTHLDIQLIKQE